MRQKPSRAMLSGRRRGFVLVTMALTTAGILGLVGLAVDAGRMLITKNEMQVYSDAAALAAANALDGTTNGFARAASAVEASGNRWNFGTSSVSNPSVLFSMAAGGPWEASPGSAAGYSYAQVTASAPVPLYFLPLVMGQTSYVVVSRAIAGQMPVTLLNRGLAPYTAVSTNPAGPNFGLVAGRSYTIHWPTFNGNRSHCGANDPASCFNSPPCPGDSDESLAAVVNNWGSQSHGYWGSNSNRAIESAVINDVQLAPVYPGLNLAPLLTAGNKSSEAGVLDERANQDTDTVSATPAEYLRSATHNGRRLLPAAIVSPVDADHTNVVGFGVFLLMTDGTPSTYYKKNTNGNSPYCAAYVGPYNLGSSGPGAGGSTGATTARLVQ